MTIILYFCPDCSVVHMTFARLSRVSLRAMLNQARRGEIIIPARTIRVARALEKTG
jgi:hypothetical protein